MAFTKSAWVLVAVYFVASLAHFSHNAQFIGLYPNMPGWLTPEKVWLAWLAITGLGFTGVVLLQLGLYAIGTLTIGVYGALGLDGLGHYTLALCSEHTLMTNLTIWAEVISGFMLMLVSAVLFSRRIARARTHPVGIVLNFMDTR